MIATPSAATSSRALMERHGWTTDALMQALSTDEQGRRINPRHELDVADLQTASGSAPIAKHHLDMALQQEPLNRAAVGVRRRLGQLRPQVRQAMQQIAHDAANHPHESAATLLAELIRLIEAEELQVKRRKAEVGAAMARCNEGLRPLQQEIAAATTPKTGISLLGRLMDAAVSVASSLVQAVGNGVDLVAQIMHAERLVNDREDYDNMLELLNAAGVLLQEARNWRLRAPDSMTTHMRRWMRRGMLMWPICASKRAANSCCPPPG